MKKYNFLTQVKKRVEFQEKSIPIGMIINSLQRPAKELLQSVCEKQKNDVVELYKTLGWTK